MINEACWYTKNCLKVDSDTCDEYCPKYTKMKYLITESRLGQKLWYPVILKAQKQDKEQFQQLTDIRSNIKNFVQQGKNLLIISKNTGCGKTTWATKLMLQYFNSILFETFCEPRALFINTVDFILRAKSKINGTIDKDFEEICSLIKFVDLVIWDDFCVKSFSDYEHDLLYSYINTRIDNGKSNIYTANTSTDMLSKTLSNRLFSRVVFDSTVIELLGEDVRGLE